VVSSRSSKGQLWELRMRKGGPPAKRLPEGERVARQTKLILGAIGADVVAVVLIGLLTMHSFVPSRLLPIISFCLFWANFVYFRLLTFLKRGNEGSHSFVTWKYIACMATAGIYFAGAIWAIILSVQDHEFYGLLGTAFSACVGIFCLRMAQRQLAAR
jgi:hypothetical protein